MENRKDIGKAFREKLDGLQKSPGDHVWQSIRQDLPKKNRRLLLPLWFRAAIIPVAALLVIGFLTYPLWQEHVPHVYFKMPRETKDEIITTKTNPSEGVAAKPEATPSLSNGTGNGAATNVTDGNTAVNKYGTTSPAKSITSVSGLGNLVSKSTESTGGATGKNSRIKGAGSSGVAARIRSGGISSGQSNPVIVESGRSNKHGGNGNTTTRDNTITLSTDAQTIDTRRINTSTSGINDGNINDASATGTDAALANTDTVTNATIAKDTLQLVARTPEKPARAARDKVETEKNKKTPQDPGVKKMYIYAFAAPTFYNTNDAGYVDNELAGKEVSVEKAFSYGGYLGYNLTPKWSMRLGVISTKIELNTKGVPLSNTYIAHGPDGENPDGWTETVTPANYSGISYADGVSNNTIRTTLSEGIDEMDQPYANVSLYQKLEYLEIPIEAIYSLYGDKFRIGITGGFSTRYLTDSRIYARNNNGSVYMGSYKDADKVNFGASIGAGLYYRFIPSLQLNAEPVLRYYFNSPDTIKPITFGVQAGLQYNFNLSKKKKK